MSEISGDCELDDIRSELHRIVTNSSFAASERNRDFLTYVVEEKLAGRESQIKAYSIATTVFGRSVDFDPQADPIVRIEASRLRRALELYYLTVGKGDSLRITVPRGGYVPVFEVPKASANQSASTNVDGNQRKRPPHSAKRSPIVFVVPFEEEGNQSEYPNFSIGFTREIIVGLTRFCNLVVYGPETSLLYSSGIDRRQLFDQLDADYLVTGGTNLAGSNLHVEVVLIDARTGRYVWAENFEQPLDPQNIVSIRDTIANDIASKLAQPYGVIFSTKARQADGKLPTDLESYDRVLQFYKYWQTYDPELHAETRKNLEQVIATDPLYAEAYACLSQIYTDAFRFGFSAGPWNDAPLQRALDLARRAIKLAPHSSRSYHAMGLVYWFFGDLRASFEALETSLELNPNDTEVMANLGHHRALNAEWDKAVPLLEASYRYNPAHPSTYRIGLALFHYAHGRYEDTLNEVRRMDTPQLVYGHLLEAAAAANMENWDTAKTALEKIREIDDTYEERIVSDLRKRNVHDSLIELLVDGLHKAGRPNGAGCVTVSEN